MYYGDIMKLYFRGIILFTAILLIQNPAVLYAQLGRQLTQFSIELSFLKNLVNKPLTPEELVDVEFGPSFFSADKNHHYPRVPANTAIALIEALVKLKPTPAREGEADTITKALLRAVEAMIEVKTGSSDELARLLFELSRLMVLYPFTIPTSIQALVKINQYAPHELFNTLIAIVSPPVRNFSREITKETTRKALSLSQEAGRQEHRRFIRESLENALMYLNLTLDQYIIYKDNTTISPFDKNQFFNQILFNWQIIKKGYNNIKNDLSDDDKKTILDTQFMLPTIADPRTKNKRTTEKYYQETRERIEGLGEATTVVKPLKILLVKIKNKLETPSAAQDNAVKNFTRMHIPKTIHESAAFLEYNYSEFDTPAKAKIAVETLEQGAKNGIKGTHEAIIIQKLAEEIKKYGDFKKANDELDDLINQMKKDPSKFATTETIEKIIKKIDEVGKKSDELADPHLKRDKKDDKKLKEALEKTKKSIHTGAKLAEELTVNLQNICTMGSQKKLEATIQGMIYDAIVYRNLVDEEKTIVLQSILGSLIKKLYSCMIGASTDIKCNVCTYGAAWIISRDIIQHNKDVTTIRSKAQPPAWVTTLYDLGFLLNRIAFEIAFKDLIH